MKILLTGVAGFIGAKVAEKLLQSNCYVIGLDNLNDYYDIRLKKWRLSQLNRYPNFRFYKVDIEDFEGLKVIFENERLSAVISLAARAGVRYSIENPHAYMRTNVNGTLNLLELCKSYRTNKFILASTSALYAGQPTPFNEELPGNTPISPYAVSKKASECIAYTYHYLYDIDVSVLRYFTVYGTAGRPDMSIFRFIKWGMEDSPIEVFGDGTQSRDFTYIDDIVEGTLKALKPVGYEIINLGNNNPHTVSYLIELIEKHVGKKARIIYKDFHKSDIKATCADITKAKKLLEWEPTISFEQGVKKTVEWSQSNWSWLKDIKL